MWEHEDNRKVQKSSRDREESPNRMTNQQGLDEKQQRRYLGCLTRPQLVFAVVGIVLLGIISSVIAVLLLTQDSGPPAPLPSFSTGGDMLDYLVQFGEISSPDGLLATWYHRANSKEEMNKALATDVMILEADVTLDGYGTPNQSSTPIMAHFPDIYSDNTLDQWLDAVLSSRKGIKLDFKSLESVGVSLDLLIQKNSSQGINRPVWLNADIVQGPNVPGFLPAINGTRFLQLIQEKFWDVTLSPGWKATYIPPLLVGTYTRAMVEEMYAMIKDVPQMVTFPVHALLVRKGWQHISWLLSRSSRFSLTLWQGSIHPTVEDLLFVRDNTHPARVYYDIYEPTLSEFKQAARKPSSLRRFYPGGDLMDFLYPTHVGDHFLSDALAVRWFTVTNRSSLLAKLSDMHGGMLVIHVASHSSQPEVPVVRGSGFKPLTLQEVLQLLGQSVEALWGIYLRVDTPQLLDASLNLLNTSHHSDKLYRPVWISMKAEHSGTNREHFVSRVDELFPHVTLVLAEETFPRIPAAVTGLSQRVALHLNATSLLREKGELQSLMGIVDIVVETNMESRAGAQRMMKRLRKEWGGRAKTTLYILSE